LWIEGLNSSSAQKAARTPDKKEFICGPRLGGAEMILANLPHFAVIDGLFILLSNHRNLILSLELASHRIFT
jgi:hypothetical protein